MAEYCFYISDFNEGDGISWYYAAKTILEDIRTLNDEKISKKEKEQRLAELNEKSKKLLLENKEMIKKLLAYYEMIKDKKEYSEEVYKIEKVLKLVKKEPDYSHIVLSGFPNL